MSKEEIEKLIQIAKKSIKCYIGTGDNAETELKNLPTEIPVLDRIIGGGLKRGRIHLFTGEFATGKTFLAQRAIVSAQKNGGKCVLIDAERRYDPKWFELTGIDIKNLIVVRPNFGEQAIDAVIDFIKQKVDVIVIDSFAALLPLEESEEGMEQKFIGLQARMLNKAFRKIVPLNDNTVIIATNQQRQEIGSRFHPGVQQRMAGGVGQYYYASLILQVRRRGWLTEKGGKVEEPDEEAKDIKRKRIGFVMECFVQKCNYAPPFERCQIPFNFYTGQLDNLASLVDLAVDMGIIRQAGPWFNYEEQKVMGKQAICDWFNQDLSRLEKLKEEILL